MRDRWRTHRLGELVRLRKGVSYKGAYLDRPGPKLLGLGTVVPGGGIRLANARTYAGPIRGWQRIAPGEMLIALTDITQDGRVLGSPGLVPLTAEDEFAITHHVARAEVIEPSLVDTKFLYYRLQARDAREYMQGVATGTTVRAVAVSDAEAFVAEYPPLSEQLAIARILGALDDKIELNRKMNEVLEAMARALFKSWFIDFDPVRAMVEGRDPGLPADIAALFPDSFVTCKFGQIPERWCVASVYEITHVIYGAPFASSEFNANADGKPLIRIRDLVSESPGIWTPENRHGGYLVRPGDIVVGMDGEFRAYLWGGAEGWLNQRVCVFVPEQGYSPAFVMESISELLSQVEATETATTVIHLGKNDIDDFNVVVPNKSVVAVWNRSIQPLYDRIVSNKRQSRTLATLRDTLLPKLLSGELRVKGV